MSAFSLKSLGRTDSTVIRRLGILRTLLEYEGKWVKIPESTPTDRKNLEDQGLVFIRKEKGCFLNIWLILSAKGKKFLREIDGA